MYNKIITHNNTIILYSYYFKALTTKIAANLTVLPTSRSGGARVSACDITEINANKYQLKYHFKRNDI